MFSFKKSYFPVHLSGLSRVRKDSKKYFYWFCAFWLLMAILELGQDYISSVLYGNVFRPAESLSYKGFWLLFIPFSILLDFGLTNTRKRFSSTGYTVCNTLLVLLITLVHLVVFSFFLFGVSNLIHENPWALLNLLAEKLSTRLYIALSIYILLSVGHFLVDRRTADWKTDSREHVKNITVKNGTRSIIVDTDDIKWISSDGPYLYIHTADKKHVILDSLKNIITLLPGNFRRIHRSVIANIDMVKELESRGNGDYDVIMDDDRVLRLSRNYARPLKGVLL